MPYINLHLSLASLMLLLSASAEARFQVRQSACSYFNSNNTETPYTIFLKDDNPEGNSEKFTFVYKKANNNTTLATFDLEEPVTFEPGFELRYRNGELVTNLEEHIAMYMENRLGEVEEITPTPKYFPLLTYSNYYEGKSFFRFKQDTSIYANGAVKVKARWRITCM